MHSYYEVLLYRRLKVMERTGHNLEPLKLGTREIVSAPCQTNTPASSTPSGVLNNNKFARYRSFNGSNLLDALSPLHGNLGRKEHSSFVQILITQCYQLEVSEEAPELLL